MPMPTRVRWAEALPDALRGVVVGNEVLDAMPVKLLARVQGVWHERGVVWDSRGVDGVDGADARWPGQTGPPICVPPDDVPGAHDYVTEIHQQGEAFVRTLADRLQAGAVFLLDYGFPEAEYYHEQRHMGTVMCHHAHQADGNPLVQVGSKDITAHVNFTGIAVAAQAGRAGGAGLHQPGAFPDELRPGGCHAGGLAGRPVAAQKLILEHEMGEFFKVMGLTKGAYWDAMGFARGDRTHRL